MSLKNWFGPNLAELLANKIKKECSKFNSKRFIRHVEQNCQPLELKSRVALITEGLEKELPAGYNDAISILLQIMGEPNLQETGMFKEYYWLMPVGYFIEKNGLENPEISLKAIYELTQRNTGEYALRPFIQKYPGLCIETLSKWAEDKSFHVRRLSSEGLRPKLPWAPKLNLFIENYKPVFSILEKLKKDETKFVQKSVANHLNDYLKLNYDPTAKLINKWKGLKNKNTQWILRHATRNFLELR